MLVMLPTASTLPPAKPSRDAAGAPITVRPKDRRHHASPRQNIAADGFAQLAGCTTYGRIVAQIPCCFPFTDAVTRSPNTIRVPRKSTTKIAAS